MNNQYMNPMMGYNNYMSNQGFNNKPVYDSPMIDGNYNIIWVNGEIGAKAYPLFKPNSFVILMDNEEDNVFYIKMTDAQGRVSLSRNKYYPEEEQTNTSVDLSQYVKKDELRDLLMSIIPQSQEEGTNNEQVIPTTTQPIIKKTVSIAPSNK